MRLGFLEFVLIVIVLLSILVIWRWMRQGGTEETDDNSPPSFLQKIGTVGILLVVGGFGTDPGRLHHPDRSRQNVHLGGCHPRARTRIPGPVKTMISFLN